MTWVEKLSTIPCWEYDLSLGKPEINLQIYWTEKVFFFHVSNNHIGNKKKLKTNSKQIKCIGSILYLLYWIWEETIRVALTIVPICDAILISFWVPFWNKLLVRIVSIKRSKVVLWVCLALWQRSYNCLFQFIYLTQVYFVPRSHIFYTNIRHSYTF